MNVTINDVGKLLLMFVITGGIFAGLALDQIEWSDAQTILALILGYVTGNGVLAARKEAPSPVLVPKNVDPVP